MAMTFDATLKDLGRDCPWGVLAEFDRPPTSPVSVLNVDLSAVTKAADLVLGLGEPLEEIVHLEFNQARRRGSTPTSWRTIHFCSTNTTSPCIRFSYCCGRRRPTRTSTAK